MEYLWLLCKSIRFLIPMKKELGIVHFFRFALSNYKWYSVFTTEVHLRGRTSSDRCDRLPSIKYHRTPLTQLPPPLRLQASSFPCGCWSLNRRVVKGCWDTCSTSFSTALAFTDLTKTMSKDAEPQGRQVPLSPLPPPIPLLPNANANAINTLNSYSYFITALPDTIDI